MCTCIRVGWAALCLLALTTPAARAAEDAAVQKAIAQGVAHLKQSQSPNGLWIRPNNGTTGASALAGLALLECGVGAGDSAIGKLAPALREGSLLLTDTYSIALCILFFDRLGDAGDVPLIESLTVRLLGGQAVDGGWTYECPNINAVEANRLRNGIKQRKTNDQPREASEKKRTYRDLPPEIQQQLLQVEQLREGGGGATTSDNSNTQFATLALWVGHRHGLPVAKALARLEERFRTTQNADGGWSYNRGGPATGTSPAMICAGLLGLAVADGFANETLSDDGAKTARRPSRPSKPRKPRDPARDRSVRAGLLALAVLIGQPQTPAGSALVVDGAKLGPTGGFPDYYFLWSLERVAVIFGLRTIGNKDWYGWGAEIALAQQRGDGSWSGGYAEGGVDTSFALLFLQRSNLVQDLTSSLRGKVEDPGEVSMRAGGVGSTLAKKNPADPAAESSGNHPNLPRPDQFVPRNNRVSPAAARLSTELVRAAPTQREALLEKLKESKGLVNTEALAAAIPQLNGASKTKARDALAERVSRMTVATLEDKLQDDDLEIRRAAALACAMKGEKKLIPNLIRLLEDPEPPVVRAAHVALKALTSQDFGPVPDANKADSVKAVMAWKSWWTKQGGALLPPDRPAVDDAVTDREKLQGTWIVIGLEREGRALTKAQLGSLHIKLIFSGDNVTFEYPDHKELGTYKLDVAASFKTIDVVTELDTSKGIYQLEGESLKICGVPNGGQRPLEFTTKPGTKQVLFVLKQQKP